MIEKIDLQKLKYALIPVLFTFIYLFAFTGLANHYQRSDFNNQWSTLNITMQIFSFIYAFVFFSWELIYHKKNVEMLYVFGILAVLNIIQLFIPAFYRILSGFFLGVAPVYGLIRPYFLYRKKLSLTGFLAGFLYQTTLFLLFSYNRTLMYNSFFATFGKAVIEGICLYFYFYVLLLLDNIDSLKDLLHTVPVYTENSGKKFMLHYSIVYTFFIVLLYLLSYLRIVMSDGSPYFLYYFIFTFITASVMLFASGFLLSNLLIQQHKITNYYASWNYLLAFIPLLNIFPLMDYSRKGYIEENLSVRYTDEELKRHADNLRYSLTILVLFATIYNSVVQTKWFMILDTKIILTNILSLALSIFFYFNKKGARLYFCFILLSFIVALIPFNLNTLHSSFYLLSIGILSFCILYRVLYEDIPLKRA
jgi:hypothetical protein